MKIQMLATVEIPLEPLFIEGQEYEVNEGIGGVLVERGHAVVVDIKPKSKK